MCVKGMVPESHEIVFPGSNELNEFLESKEFKDEVQAKLKAQYEVDMHINKEAKTPDASASSTESILLSYTRNNAGGLKDAVDFLISRLVARGLDATTIKGSIPRPKSDSFEDNLHFFNSKLLQHAPAPVTTDSPTKENFTEEVTERSIFDRLRKPGSISSISSFLERRKNQSASPGSFFKNNSSNGSKASLLSIESRESAYRNPWNDSGVNLPEEEHPQWPSRHLDHSKFPFLAAPGDTTPKHDPRASFDSGRPSTSHSASGYPGPIGPPR